MKKPKKVLLMSTLFHPNVGGVENSIKEITNQLNTEKIETTIITSNRNHVTDELLKSEDNFNGARLFRCDYPNGIFGWFFFLTNLSKLLRILKNDQFDLVITRSHWTLLAAKLSGLLNVKYLVPAVTLFEEKKSLSFFLSKAIFRCTINSIAQSLAFFVSNVYVFSNTMQLQIKFCTFGLITPKIVNPGVSKLRFQQVNITEKEQLKKNLNLKKDITYILGVGRFAKIKQFDLVIKSLQFLPEQYQLILVGEGDEYSNYIKIAKDLSIEHRVHFFPFTDQVHIYYQASDIYAMSSRYESFGQVLLEASSCGLVIAGFSKKSGAQTATNKIYAEHESLVSFCDSMTSEALAYAIENAKIKKNSKDFSVKAEEFSRKYDWSELLKILMSQ